MQLSRTLVGLLLVAPLAAAPLPTLPRDYAPSLKLVDLSRSTGAREPGFLTASRNGFRWSNGTRARFWGVNIANRNLWIERDEIDQVVEQLAASGVNMVRFEALDSKGGLLEIEGRPGTRQLNPERLSLLHYWIAKVRARHMHYYLDLIDFRDFVEEDGVENARQIGRAGRPYAMFDPTLIELQKEYATQLLTTENPYTHLTPVEDPALALLEICNESGFFLYPKVTDNLVEPYRSRLADRWREWLHSHYQNRAELANAWGPALAEGEDLDSAALPQLGRVSRDPRQQDGIHFLHDVERAYCATMRDHLRGLGLRIPITAVVSSDVPADLAAVAAELDFTAENHYTDHPSFGGPDWQGKYFHSNKNALRDDSRFTFAPFTAALRWNAKPVVVREWAAVWPNQFRGSSVLEAAAYARLQDIDGMLLFGTKTGPVRDRLVAFGYQADPTVWDMFGMGALMFERGDVSTPSQIALLEYGPAALFRGDASLADLNRLAFGQRLASAPEGGAAPLGDLTILPANDKAPRANDWLAQLPVPGGRRALTGSVYTSSTGQLRRDVANGRITVETPRALGVAGELLLKDLRLNSLTVSTDTAVGSLWMESLDGKPLPTSTHWVLKMSSVASNTGQKLSSTAGLANAPAPYVLEQEGTAPVLTGGSTRGSTRLTLPDGSSLTVQQQDGTWEACREDDLFRFWSDTAGAQANYAGKLYALPPR